MATKQQPKYKVLDTWRDAVFQKHGFYPQLNIVPAISILKLFRTVNEMEKNRRK